MGVVLLSYWLRVEDPKVNCVPMAGSLPRSARCPQRNSTQFFASMIGETAITIAPPNWEQVPLVIALDAGTGGPSAKSEILRHFSANSVPNLIVQHISDRFLLCWWRAFSVYPISPSPLPSPVQRGKRVSSRGDEICPRTLFGAVLGGRIKILSPVVAAIFEPSIKLVFNLFARSSHTAVIAAPLTEMIDLMACWSCSGRASTA